MQALQALFCLTLAFAAFAYAEVSVYENVSTPQHRENSACNCFELLLPAHRTSKPVSLESMATL